ncbi:uncharacterized protein FFNC_15334 [Fusarium fujikuroi]|nr:uncharacterized protein FFNC_15334 [Fusarium fujikuroi]
MANSLILNLHKEKLLLGTANGSLEGRNIN